MTTEQLIQYYAGLLILQYLQKAKAVATIKALVGPAIMDQLPTDVQNAFTIGTAQGVQLDVLGKYAGVTRYGYGFDGPVTLTDDEFTSLITLAIVKASSGSSLATIQDFLHAFFPDEILVFDFKNMRMSYFINSTVGSVVLAQVFVTSGLLPVPMGVQYSVIYSPNIFKFFGFRTYGAAGVNNTPFNTYDVYDMDRPWLKYADEIF